MTNKSLPMLAWAAFFTLCIVWGTTYFGIKIGVKYFPPFFFSGLRHLLAGGSFLLIYYLFMGKREGLSWRDMGRLTIAGMLLINGGNALLSWAEIYISSGLAGILSALAPLYVTFMSIFVFKGFRITWLIVLGLALSIVGIVFISKPDDGVMDDRFWLGFWLTVVANVFWGMGSVFIRKYPINGHVFLKTGFQMIPASIINIIISGIIGENVQLSTVPTEGWWAVAYLVVIGSLVGYMSFVYLLEHMPPARVTIHVYVNTVVAVLVGWLFGGEHVYWWTFAAMAVTMVGVIIVNSEYARMARLSRT